MVNLQNIHSLTEFKRNANSYIETIRSTKAPIVLTVNGEAAVVVQDAIAFQEILDRLTAAEEQINELKLVALRQDIQVGIDQLENGQYTDYTEETLDELFDEIVTEGRAGLGLMR
jgi:prevent-host-death family protein